MDVQLHASPGTSAAMLLSLLGPLPQGPLCHAVTHPASLLLPLRGQAAFDKCLQIAKTYASGPRMVGQGVRERRAQPGGYDVWGPKEPPAPGGGARRLEQFAAKSR